MSQPAGTERPPPARAAGGGGNLLTRRYGGVPGWAWVAIVSLVAGGVIWYVQRKKAARSAAQTSTSTAQGPTQATCYDANGATVACSDPLAVGSNATDYFEALYAQGLGINSQLENIGPQVTETGQDADAIQALLQNLPGSTSTPPPGTVPPPPAPGPVRDLTVTVASPTLARVSWLPPAVPPTPGIAVTAARHAYTIQIQGKDASAHNIGFRTSYNVGGLRPGGHYTAVVAPVGGPPASRAFTMPARAGLPSPTSNWPGGRQPPPAAPFPQSQQIPPPRAA